jgi:competence protein ComEC
VVPYLRRKGIQKLDLVVLTHAHEDHVGGLPAVLEKIKVDSVLDTGYIYESKTYRRFLDLIRRNKIKYGLARSGQSLNFGGNTVAKVLHPDRLFLEECENINNASIVFRLHYGGFSMLFTGDNEKEGEERILELFSPAALVSTILKVGHHGSRTSTSSPFLEAVRPEAAIISCGRRNKFKHPHRSTLKKLEAVRTYRTDKHGAIIIKSNGRGFRIGTARD